MYKIYKLCTNQPVDFAAFISGDNVSQFDVKFENGELILAEFNAQQP